MKITQLRLWEEQQSKFDQTLARKQAWLLRQPERERRAKRKHQRRLLSLRHALAHSYQERERWTDGTGRRWWSPRERCTTQVQKVEKILIL